MKTIETLKKLISLYYYFLVLGFIFFALLPVLFWFNKIKSLNLIEGYDFKNLSLLEFFIITVVLISIYFFFVKAIYLLKETLKDLSEGNYFSELVTNNFKTIGKYVLICGI